MKVKYKINSFKEKIEKIRYNVKNNTLKKEKIPLKYYTLLVGMLIISMGTFVSNTKKYNDLSAEKYTKYTLEDNIIASSKDIETINYKTAISSISTNVANEESGIKEKYKYCWPIKGELIKEYAMDKLVYSKTLEMWKTHSGIDIAAKLDSEVVAVYDGKIISIEQDNFYGNTVKIEHTEGYISVYSNLDNLFDIELDMFVKQGQVIGKVGVSAHGEIADQSHLHFEIIKNNEWINPMEVLE